MSQLETLSLISHLQRVSGTAAVATVPIEAIQPNPVQPRKHFDAAALEELAESIKTQGLMQPLAVREVSPSRYQLIAGERRWRASKLAGLSQVPVTFVEVDSLEGALVENLQRQDMNAAEEVSAVLELVRRKKSGVAAGKAIGKSAQWISKRVCVGEAPDFVAEFVAAGRSDDLEGLYELARLAVRNETAAREIVSAYVDGTSLRSQIRGLAGIQPPEPSSNDGAEKPLPAKRRTPRPDGESGKVLRASDVEMAGEILTFAMEGPGSRSSRIRLSRRLSEKLARLLRSRSAR